MVWVCKERAMRGRVWVCGLAWKMHDASNIPYIIYCISYGLAWYMLAW